MNTSAFASYSGQFDVPWLLWSGNEVYGVSGKSGATVYRGQAPAAEVIRNGIVQRRLEALTLAEANTLPQFTLAATDLRYGQDAAHTVVHRAWPAKSYRPSRTP